ncbi:MAG: adenylosuccinate synthase [Planctomycetota bacterium]
MSDPNVAVTGLQWGDEGKGKVVDALAAVSRYVVRYCGGANAGHTVVRAGEKFALHLVPCGVLRPEITNVVANGVAFDPAVALEEIDALRDRGVDVGPENLLISTAAHVVMPWHKAADAHSEHALAARRIGTTARGIGPCYADKANRSTAVRVGDLARGEALREKVRLIVETKNTTFAALYGAEAFDADAIAAEYAAYGRRLEPMLANTGAVLRRAVAEGERILFEGGQGSMLDIDHGTFPFVTSSSVSACGVPQGAGVPPRAVGTVVGLLKAYTTRVGAGPFPTEQDNDTGAYLRDRGNEYGTTTGRPRRCGWLDLFAARYAAELSGVDEVALALLDVLTGLDEIKLCTAYRVGDDLVEDFDPALLGAAEPVYETLPGWGDEIGTCEAFADLPGEAKAYVDRIEAVLDRPIGVISVGPDREQMLVHHTGVRGLR